MTVPGNDLLLVLLTLSVFLSSAYAVGRIHQWERCSLERDEAYQVGYDKASRAIVGMMTARHLGSRREPRTAELDAAPHFPRRGRHIRTHRLAAEKCLQLDRRGDGDRSGA
jgi:hypothetical protein